jgi:hypothetical protein
MTRRQMKKAAKLNSTVQDTRKIKSITGSPLYLFPGTGASKRQILKSTVKSPL